MIIIESGKIKKRQDDRYEREEKYENKRSSYY
jgi:hypothetical protein